MCFVRGARRAVSTPINHPTERIKNDEPEKRSRSRCPSAAGKTTPLVSSIGGLPRASEYEGHFIAYQITFALSGISDCSDDGLSLPSTRVVIFASYRQAPRVLSKYMVSLLRRDEVRFLNASELILREGCERNGSVTSVARPRDRR